MHRNHHRSPGVLLALSALCALVTMPIALPRSATADDSYLCYKAKLAKGQPKLAKGLSTALQDRLAGPLHYDVKKVVSSCNPVAVGGSAVVHPTVHLEGFATKLQKGQPKFAKSTQTIIDALTQRNLTIKAPSLLLDVTPQALGAVPPAAFGADPTGDSTVNRWQCYGAKLAKGSPKFVAPSPPTLTDDFFAGGQVFTLKKITKLCLPVDADGQTVGAEARATSLVCYGAKLAKGAPKFAKPVVATNGADFGTQVLLASAPSELCVAAQPVIATPTPTPTATPNPTGMKHVFVTSATQDASFGGPLFSDPTCATIAANAGLSGTYKSWISYSGDSPSTRFTHATVPYALRDGTIVANDWNDLTDGTLQHAIDQDENGATVTAADVWTGTTAAGGVPPENPNPPTTPYCNNWQNDSNVVNGVRGNTARTDAGWSSIDQVSCDHQLRFYCFEQ